MKTTGRKEGLEEGEVIEEEKKGCEGGVERKDEGGNETPVKTCRVGRRKDAREGGK